METKAQREERTKTLLMFSGIARENGKEITQSEISNDLDLLHRYEATLHRIAENECNGHPRTVTERRDGKVYRYSVEDTEWAARDERKEQRTREKVKVIADKYGIGVDFNGDPRGGAIRFTVHDGRSNNWDQKTWGIYWVPV